MKPRWESMLAMLVSISLMPAGGQIPTFSVKTEEVRIDVLVSEDGKPVKGLQADDFIVLDNAVPQTIASTSFQQIPISATLVLDMSQSVAGDQLDHLKAAGSALLKGLKKGERSALITFSHFLRLGSPLTTDLDRVEAALWLIEPQSFGKTSLIDASYAGLIQAESKADRPMLIIFSDGVDTSSWLTDEMVLESARFSDTVVYAVSAGRLPDRKFLRDLSKITGGSLFEIESTEDLDDVFLSILEEFRHRYLLTYLPRDVSERGWHKLEVRVKRRGLKVKHRPGYSPDAAGSYRESAPNQR